MNTDFDEQLPASDGRKTRPLPLFLNNLPARSYGRLRQKLIPGVMAAKMLGISPTQLACLNRHKLLSGKDGLYDVVSILLWLDSDYNPDTEAFNAQ